MTVLSLPLQFGYIYLFISSIALARASKPMLSESVRSVHPWLVPNLGRKAFSFSLLSQMLFVGWPHVVCIVLKYIPFIPTLWRVLNHERMVNFFKCFFCAYWDDLVLLMGCITLIDLWTLNHSCTIPGVNPKWSWCMILLMHCWIQFPNYFVEDFASVFIKDICL